MNRYEMGRRIKEARLAKKMTQTDVAGDFITRNMLSQIESGTANPSLKTLEYISSVLDIPIGTLLPDGRDEIGTGGTPAELLTEGKALYNNGEFAEAVEKVSGLMEGELWDEAYGITARSYIKMAEQAEKNGDMMLAAELADKAYAAADKGVYASRDIRTASALLLNRIAEKLEK